ETLCLTLDSTDADFHALDLTTTGTITASYGLLTKSVDDGDVNLTIRNTAGGGSALETVSLIAQTTTENKNMGKIVFGRLDNYTGLTDQESFIDFYTVDTPGGPNLLAMRIDENQRVGIGTTDPQVELDVSGDITATGTIQAEQLTSTDDITMAGLFTNTESVAITSGTGYGMDVEVTNTGETARRAGVYVTSEFRAIQTGDILTDESITYVKGISGTADFTGTVNNATAVLHIYGNYFEPTFNGINTANNNIKVVGSYLFVSEDIGT
ncbi:unnamed protein product, partial [marine sediment metagenome]